MLLIFSYKNKFKRLHNLFLLEKIKKNTALKYTKKHYQEIKSFNYVQRNGTPVKKHKA